MLPAFFLFHAWTLHGDRGNLSEFVVKRGIDRAGGLGYVLPLVLPRERKGRVFVMIKSFTAKQEEVTRKWHVVDATDKPAGRLSVGIVNVLRGKDKPTFTPHVDTGDFVVVINAGKVKLTGDKEDKKIYKHYTGYPSGLKKTTARKMREKHPNHIILHAVKGMLPKNRLSRQVFKRLKVYAGPEHPHAAQNPRPLEI